MQWSYHSLALSHWDMIPVALLSFLCRMLYCVVLVHTITTHSVTFCWWWQPRIFPTTVEHLSGDQEILTQNNWLYFFELYSTQIMFILPLVWETTCKYKTVLSVVVLKRFILSIDGGYPEQCNLIITFLLFGTQFAGFMGYWQAHMVSTAP